MAEPDRMALEKIRKDVLKTYDKYLQRTDRHSGKYQDQLFKALGDGDWDFLNSIASEIKCTMCGKTFTQFDLLEGFPLRRHMGYGSKYDDSKLEMKLCCDCFDKVIDFVKDNSTEDPIVDEEYTTVSLKKKASLDKLEVTH